MFDFWEDGAPGEGALQWIALRYVIRLFQRLGADDEVTELQRAIRGGGMSGKEAVAFARSSLQRYC